MKIQFLLSWLKPGAPLPRAFKQESAYTLFSDFAGRIGKFTSCDARGARMTDKLKESGSSLWICDRGRSAKALTSRQVSERIDGLRDSGVKGLKILIGGPDGVKEDEMRAAKPDFIWSFGPLTLPHELAAIVAAEQIYRAFTILARHPYHMGH